MLLAALGVIAVGGATAVWLARASNPAPASASVAEQSTRPFARCRSPAAAAYEIDAAFYRVGRNGEEQLAPGGRVAPGDELFLKFQASVPINLYVVNEDDKGEVLSLVPSARTAPDQSDSGEPAGDPAGHDALAGDERRRA